MKNTLIEPSVVRAAMEQFDVTDLNNGSIRQIGGIVKTIEERTGEEFVHLEMGVPGLPPEKVGIAAEHAALDAGVASIYAGCVCGFHALFANRPEKGYHSLYRPRFFGTEDAGRRNRGEAGGVRPL